jgi:3-oxoacyl-[acyl-carrier-protein] synthase II
VVVTGLGVVSPLGVGAEALIDRWCERESGIVDGIGACSDFEPAEFLSRKELRRTDRFTQLAIAASDEALAQAGWSDGVPYDPTRVACIIGTGIGGLESAQDAIGAMEADGNIPTLTVPLMMPNAAAGVLAMRHRLQGPCFAVASACAAGADAIASATRALRSGDIDAAVTGGSEAPLTPFGIAAFAAMEATSESGISRPFDARRDGFVMAEGAAVLVLEGADTAAGRGAEVLGEVLGCGETADAFHLVAPDPNGQGAAIAMRRALEDAGIRAAEVDYVNAHGTATELNDRSETVAIKIALGPVARQVPVSSLKSAVGHSLGAAGAVEAVATVLALRRRVAPPTLNYEEPEQDLDLNYVADGPQPLPERSDSGSVVGLTNSFGFGGHNAVICFASAP